MEKVVRNHFAKAAITGVFRRASHHSVTKTVKLKSFTVRKISKMQKLSLSKVQKQSLDVFYK